MSAERSTPSGLRAGGRRLWRSVADDYDLLEHEAVLLLEACRCVDSLDLLDAQVRREGVTVPSPQGDRVHPGLVEARQQRIVLARLLAGLRLPAGEEGDQQACPAATAVGLPRYLRDQRSRPVKRKVHPRPQVTDACRPRCGSAA